MLSGISGGGREDFVRLLRHGRRVISVDDAVDAMAVGRPDAAKRLASWAARGWLRRVRRGLYIPVPLEAENPAAWTDDALYLGDAVWAPCYFTGWTAANHWGLTDQVFRTTVVKTTRRVRREKHWLLDHEYLIAHISIERMWGLTPIWRQDRKIQMADASRTVLDMLDTPSVGGGIRHVAEVLGAYLDEHDGKELIAYGDRLENGAVFKRLGYVVETLGGRHSRLLADCRQRITAGFADLDPRGPKGGKLSTAWGLRINVRPNAGHSS